MTEFSKVIATQFDIDESVAHKLCAAFTKKLLPPYLIDYEPSLSAELSIELLWGVFDTLSRIAELEPKKKRIANALKKAGTTDEALLRRVEMTTNSWELDDILLPLRPNPRSRAQLALKKGLQPLAESVARQEEENTPVEELAKEYVGKDSSLKSVEDVLEGVKDILAERFAYDETVRAMAREFCLEDGFITVTPKSKKETAFSKYKNKNIELDELTNEELLTLFSAEDAKRARVKIGVPIFRITEVLRNHFIENPDFTGFDLICEIIDDSWQRLLFPIIERDVKSVLRDRADNWALAICARELDDILAEKKESLSTILSVGTDENGFVVCAAINPEGRLLGVSVERKSIDKMPPVSDKMRKLLARYHPQRVLIEAGNDRLEETVKRTVEAEHENVDYETCASREQGERALASDWMKKNFGDLEPSMQRVYANGLMALAPVETAIEMGTHFFTFHPLQPIISPEKFSELLKRKVMITTLHDGVLITDIADSPLKNLPGITVDTLQAIRTANTRETVTSKKDIHDIPGISKDLYTNIAGYIIVPSGMSPLDRTLVHPDHYDLVESLCESVGISLEVAIDNPSLLLSCDFDSYEDKIFVQKNLEMQLNVGKKYVVAAAAKGPRRKNKLAELQEGMVVPGRVTNIMPFGVFVDIHAVCDGLVHISQLADTYVETPDQVVSVGDKVHVRIVKVDSKKRRISLSMKELGNQAPKVKPTFGQLSSLVDHFSNR